MSESVHHNRDGQRAGPLREAVFQLDWTDIDAIGWGRLLSHCRAAGLREMEMLEGDCCQCVCELELESSLDETVLAELECIIQWEFLTEADGTCLYLLELTAPALPEAITENHEELIGTCEPTLSDRGIVMSIRGPQEPIREVIHTFEAIGVTPTLRKIGEYRGDSSMLDSLTDRQREVIEIAYDLGFYEVPRQATMENIAAQLDIDAATVSEHLQRAERNLLRQEFTRT
jgi:DNA-binding CsgD family transcriptional regulator